MFDWKKIFKSDNDDNIDLKDLYVGRLGIVQNNYDTNKSKCITLKNNNIIAFKYFGDTHEPYGIDVFTNTKYYIFKTYIYKELINHKLVLTDIEPLSVYLSQADKLNGYISKEKLSEILYYANNPEKLETKKDDNVIYIQEPIIDKILLIESKLKKMNIEEIEKNTIFCKLKILSEFYTTRILEINYDEFEVKYKIDYLRYEINSILSFIEEQMDFLILKGYNTTGYIDEFLTKELKIRGVLK